MHSKTISFLQTQVDVYDTVNMIELAKLSQIENRHVFEKYFKKLVEETIKFSSKDDLTTWAKDIKGDNYEVLERARLCKYWLWIEKRKLRRNLEYLALVKLNKTTKMEADFYRERF